MSLVAQTSFNVFFNLQKAVIQTTVSEFTKESKAAAAAEVPVTGNNLYMHVACYGPEHKAKAEPFKLRNLKMMKPQ